LIHTFAWLSWLAVSLVALSLTRNPLYLLLILLCLLFVSLWLQKREDGARPAVHPLRFTLILVTLGALFNAFTSHYGSTILFTIPGKIPLLSGHFTLEALVYGATNGLILAGMFASFTVLNQALPTRALVRLIPRAFYPVALVTSIAVTYLPTTIRLSGQIREAQEIRGHQVRGIRDWLPLLMPLLVGGMEHAMQLAEAMTARGFASAPLPIQPVPSTRTSILPGSILLRLALLSGLLLLSAGWLWRLNGGDGFGLALICSGALLILGSLWQQGRHFPRTSYRKEKWRLHDSLVLAASLLLLALLLLPLPFLDRASLAYSAYPLLTLPPFYPILGLAMLGLLLPVVVSKSH
jgi:energy-coupling factor transport system permease protein